MTDPSQAKQPAAASLRRKVTLAFLAGLLALLACEISLQLTEQPATTIRFQQDVGELDQLGMKRLASIVENDNELFWELTPNTTLSRSGGGPFFGVIANNQGLREDHAISSTVPADGLRVLFLGDSCTFGYGLDHTEGYVDIAEQQLNKRLNTKSVECINAGVPGYTLFQGWQRWRNQGNSLQADFVVVCFGGNDMSSWDNKTDQQHYEHLQRTDPPGLLRHSALGRRAWATFHSMEVGPAQPKPRVPPGDFQQLLGQLHASIQAHDARMVILVWPFLFQVEKARDRRTPWQEAMVSFAAQHGVLLLDLVPLFHKLADEHGAQALYLDQGHATALGNRATGNRVAEFLEQKVVNMPAGQP